jgi:hypothetical protein
MREPENIDTERVANPIEYLQLRRRVGGSALVQQGLDAAARAAPPGGIPAPGWPRS